MFHKASTHEQGANLPPSFGLQFFGHVAIDGTSEIMTVTLKDMGNTALWSVDIAPQPQYRIGPAVVPASQHGTGFSLPNRRQFVGDAGESCGRCSVFRWFC